MKWPAQWSYDQPEAGIISKHTSGTVADGLEKFTDIVAGSGMKILVIIDHRGEAKANGLDLRETKLVILGNPMR